MPLGPVVEANCCARPVDMADETQLNSRFKLLSNWEACSPSVSELVGYIIREVTDATFCNINCLDNEAINADHARHRSLLTTKLDSTNRITLGPESSCSTAFTNWAYFAVQVSLNDLVGTAVGCKEGAEVAVGGDVTVICLEGDADGILVGVIVGKLIGCWLGPLVGRTVG